MTRHLLAALLFAAFMPLPASAQSGTVTVAGQVKRTEGTVVKLVNGDIACSVELKDDSGRSFQESADFKVCSQKPSLVGRRVALTWTVANVQAASCGGDPNCRKSERVPLIASARIVDGKTAAAPATTPAPAAVKDGGQASFCTPLEQVIFACRTGAKLVSVCASKGATATSGYLQYRFGKPDSADPLDMLLPESQLPAARVATADNMPFSGGGASWMRFRRGDHAYVVYSGIGKWGPRGETQERAGVVVERNGKRIASLRCTGKDSGEMGPDWFQRVGLSAKGEDFDLPN